MAGERRILPTIPVWEGCVYGGPQARVDFFISYTSSDRAWAEWIAWQLKKAGSSVVLQAWDMVPGLDFVHEMQKATTTAKRTLAVLSPAYFTSQFGEAEWRVAFADDPSGEQRRLIPVRVVNFRPAGLLATRIYVDLVGKDRQAARLALLEGVQGQPAAVPAEEPAFPGEQPAAVEVFTPAQEEPRLPSTLPQVWNVPYPRNWTFTGRDDLLEELAAGSGRGTATAITQAIAGLGGVGKTSLAVEYAYRQQAAFDLVWWVRAEEPATLLGDFIALAGALGLPERAQTDPPVVVEAVRRWLAGHARWLLVFDNVTRPEDVTPLLPPGGGGQVLVTSRWGAWRELARPIHLNVMAREEAGWLGRHRAPILWLAAVGAFLLTTQLLVEDGRLWEIFVPPVAALIALPLGLAAATPLRAWRLQVVVAAATPLVVPPRGWVGPPWLPTLVFVATYVTWTVAVRLDLHLLVGVWLVTDATIVFWYMASWSGVDALNQAYVGILLATVLIALGYLTGTRRRLTFELVEGRRREQEEQARSTLLEERARIARELHDVVAHHMSVIAVRAETAPFRIPGLPEAVKDDMAETSTIAREALTEMRRLLGVLRGADVDAERVPQPGMDRLEGLAAAVRGAGLTVDVRVEGAKRPLPPAVELSAYRILQEALSNVLRHAPGAPAAVEVRYEPECLRLRVRNERPPGPGPHPAPGAAGHGIVGMRERVAMLGGALSAGPASDGGYLVEAVLPLAATPADGDPR